MTNAAAQRIADKYIARDGQPPASRPRVVWAPVAISVKERDWLAKAILRGGFMPTRERDGDAAPFLSEMRSMHQRGLVQGLPWRITKFGRQCLHELDRSPSDAAAPHPAARLSAPEPVAIRPLAVVEREAIQHALSQLGGNRTRAAKALGISIRTIRNKIRAYGGAARA